MDKTVIDQRYELIEVIGEGGEARVYRAIDLTDGTAAAVRTCLHPRTASAHEIPSPYHPGWVGLLAAGTDAGLGAYQALELLEGLTLAQLVRGKPLDSASWREFVTASLDSVGALHDAFWVHGDLNADNFFSAPAGWKLIELPFLRLDPPKGRTAAFGSIHTLAPEQIDGAPADARSDLYSLGCLYYYAASGTWPHPGPTAQDVAIHCLRFEPEPLAGKAKTLAAPWCDWVMHLLARRPDERPASARTPLPF
jgi:serine/threonine protein kinase